MPAPLLRTAMIDRQAIADQFGVWYPGARRKTAFHIVGPYNTGTNFLHALLDANGIPHTPTAATPNIYKDAFKHYPWPVTVRVLAARSTHTADLVFLVMARDPYSWLLALRKSPYEMEYTDYVSPCAIGTHAINHDASYAQHLRTTLAGEEIDAAFRFGSVVDYWTRFYGDYLSAYHKGAISVLFLRYEDAVQATPECINFLRAGLGLPPSDHFHVPVNPAKEHGQASGYLTARARGEPRTAFSEADRAAIEAQLSPDICHAIGYPRVVSGDGAQMPQSSRRSA